jgi:chromate transporter
MTYELKPLSSDPARRLPEINSSSSVHAPKADTSPSNPEKNADTTTKDNDFTKNWKNIASSFLKVGVTYGQMWGVMQAELQEKQHWVSKERFVEGLSLVNMLPGAPGPQLAIILGYARGGMWGGLLAGLCLVLPSFFILLVLTKAYASLGGTSMGRGALYGVGPVVLGILGIAAYRLGKSTVRTITQTMIATLAAAALIWGSLGIAAILLLAGGVGLFLFHSKKVGAAVLVLLTVLVGILRFASWPTSASATTMSQLAPPAAGVTEVAAFFFKIGALTFGGGLSMIAFIHEQVVNQFHWLTPQEFIDGLALGQLTPGPILMVAAYVGYKVAGIGGAGFAAAAIFLPAFMMMLALLPMLDRVRTLVWTKAALQGIGPALIGVISISLVQMAPHALPDPFAIAIFIATDIALLRWRVDAVKLIIAGAAFSLLWSRFFSLHP